MQRLKFVVAFFLLAGFPIGGQEPAPRYKDAHLAIPDGVADLLSRMTLEEQVDEITGGHFADRGLVDTTRELPYKSAADVLKEMRALAHNAMQRYQREKTRLGIPIIFFGEALHGYMAYGSTSFPQALALASTWDPALVKQVFTAASDEMSASGANQAFTPVLFNAQSAVSMSKPGIGGMGVSPPSVCASTKPIRPEPEGVASLRFGWLVFDSIGLSGSERHGYAEGDAFLPSADLPFPLEPSVVGVEWSGLQVAPRALFERKQCVSEAVIVKDGVSFEHSPRLFDRLPQ